MNPTLSRTTLLWLGGLVAAIGAPLTVHVPIWISVFMALALVLRCTLANVIPLLILRLVLVAMTLSAAVLVYWQFGTLLGRDAGVALLSLMLSLKLLETRTHRDGMLVVFLSSFLLLSDFLYSQSLFMVLHMAGMAVLITMVLIQLNQGSAVVNWRARIRTAGLLVLEALPVMLILFVLFPRLSGPIWARPDNANRGVAGLSDHMSPGDISQLIQSTAVAFRVDFDGERPAPDKRYWRGPVLERFDGNTWRPRAHRSLRSARHVQANTHPIRYTVTLEPHHEHWLYALELPTTAPQDARIDGNYELLAREPVDHRRTYTLTSTLQYTLDRELNDAQRTADLQLPPNGGEQARKLARRWRRISATDSAVVKHALRFFRRQPFVYTLQPPLIDDPVDDFLFRTRRGFCEHFAGSFVVLMRAAGIPARVVTGYSGGEWNPLGDYLLIRQADAHAWSEVWLPHQGWIRIDPTAVVSPARVEQGIGGAFRGSSALPFFLRGGLANGWVNDLRLLWDNINYQWNAQVLAFGAAKQRALMARLGFKEPTEEVLVGGLIIAMTTLLALYGSVFAWRNRPKRPAPEVRLYARLGRRLARRGLARAPWEGPIDYAQRLTVAKPELDPWMGQIATLYARLRYASKGGKDSGRADLKRLRKLIRTLPL